MLLIAPLIWNIVMSPSSSANRSSYIAQPLVNDVYLADLSKITHSGFENHNEAYGAIKLMSIDNNGNLTFSTSKEAYSKKKNIRRKLRESEYMQTGFNIDALLVLTPEQVKTLESKRIIYSIKRN